MANTVDVPSEQPFDSPITVVDSSYSSRLCNSLLLHGRTFSGTVEACPAQAQGCLDVFGYTGGLIPSGQSTANKDHELGTKRETSSVSICRQEISESDLTGLLKGSPKG